MSTGVIVLCGLLGAVAGALVVVPALRTVPERWDPTPRAAFAVIVANAALWALAADKFTRGWVLLPYLVVFSVLLAVSVVDLRLLRIPDRFVFPGLALTMVLIVLAPFLVLPSAGDAFRVVRVAAARLPPYSRLRFTF